MLKKKKIFSLTKNTLSYTINKGDFMNICGFQKLTLLDFPGHTACTVFTGGCNMRCPFCHNAPLVTGTGEESYTPREIFSFLEKRQGLLDGVAVTGGEPLLQKDIVPFLSEIKSLGYKIKLDTNGSLPEKLSELIGLSLVDFVAMDIKNTPEKYSLTAGTPIDFSLIEKSVSLLKESGIPHEFRTTVMGNFHTLSDITEIARFLGKTEKYYLQQFRDSGNILSDGCFPVDEKLLSLMAEKAGEYVLLCETRGI